MGMVVEAPDFMHKNLSEHFDLAVLVCEKYHDDYSCWSYDPVARKLTVNVGELFKWDYGEQDAQALAIFQHLRCGLVDELVFNTKFENSVRVGGKMVYFDDVVALYHFKELFSLIDFEKVKCTVYPEPLDGGFPTKENRAISTPTKACGGFTILSIRDD